MRRHLFSVLAVWAALSTTLFAEDSKKAMEGQVKAFEKAIREKDISWFEKVAAPDFHETSVDGKNTPRAQAIAMMKQMFAMPSKILKMKSTVTKVWTKGKFTMVHIDMNVSNLMTMPGAKKPTLMDSKMTNEETWSNKNGKWQIHHLKTLKEENKMNGKPMPPGSMGG